VPAIVEQVPIADRLAMRDRATVGRLTDDGARSFYVNDVNTLLDVVERLEREVAETRQSFYEDGAQASQDANLREWAEAWKAEATGYWEKTQTKKLREQIAELKIQHAQTGEALIDAETTLTAMSDKAAKLQDDLIELEDKLLRREQEHRAAIQYEQELHVALRDEINTLNKALVDCSERCEQVLALQQAQSAQQRQEALESIVRAVELLS
jgi:hypothetical protein